MANEPSTMMPESHISDFTAIMCPCLEFETIQSVHSALDSEERAKVLLGWLSSTTNEGQRLSCQPRVGISCARRVSASLSILNGIRDACRPFLEVSKAISEPQEPTYEESFPSLSQRSEEPKASTTPNGKDKIRVSPEQVSAWANGKGNIANLPSTEPLSMRRQLVQVKHVNNSWPVIPSGQNSSSKNAVTVNVKRRVSLEPATAWGNAAPENLSTASRVKAILTAADIPKVARTATNKQARDKSKRRLALQPATAWGDAAPGSLSSVGFASMNHAWSKESGKDVVIHQGPANATRPVQLQAAPALGNSTHGSSSTSLGHDFPSVPLKAELRVETRSITSQLVGVNNNDPPNSDYASGSKEVTALFSLVEPSIQVDRTEERLRLAEVYATLILRRLVPSTALELHLLVRLLTAKDDEAVIISSNESIIFQTLFASASNCRSFAVEVMTRLEPILRYMHSDLVAAFVAFPAFADLLPNVTTRLREAMESRRETSLLSEVDVVSIIGSTRPQMPLITLPFDHERDSRHNYASREGLAVYKNREESRDAFLYQLRAFQNVRGKVLDAVQAERSIDRIRMASKNVVQGMMKCNMHWFAQMFCDLLLQIGLVPMEETDKELLSIIDKEKLQKLHKRFSSKGTQTRKSTKNLVLDPSNSSKAASPVAEAQHFFPGHQEFFFIFIMSTDSYTFGIHLKNCLKQAIFELESSDNLARGLEKRLSQLQLLSRFLGLVVFSPYWDESGLKHSTVSDEVGQSVFELPVLRMVKDAWKKRRLVSTIPWVVEFLRMARWSPSLQMSEAFKVLLSFLLGVYHRIIYDTSDGRGCLQVNMQFVSLFFETLFGEIFGLEMTVSLSVTSVAEHTVLPNDLDEEKQLDAAALRLSTSILFISNPYVEAIAALLSSLTQKQLRPFGSSRKLTLSSIDGNVTSPTDLLQAPVSLSISNAKLPRDITSAAQSDSVGSSQEQGDSHILAKLVEAFFHQHRDLKALCEFVVDQTLKSISAQMRDECVVPILRLIPETSEPHQSLLVELENVAFDKCRLFVSSNLATSIPQALALLSPKHMQRRVRDVAAKLSISHATRLGESTIESLIRVEMKKMLLDRSRTTKMKISTSKVQEPFIDSDTNVLLDAGLLTDTLVTLRNALTNRMWERRPEKLMVVVTKAKDARSGHDSVRLDSVLGFVESVERGSVPLLQWCLHTDTCEPKLCWKIAADYLQLLFFTATTSDIPVLRAKVRNWFDEEKNTDALIQLGLQVESKNAETFGSFLVRGINGGVLSEALVAYAMLRSLGSSGRVQDLSHYLVAYLEELQTNLGVGREAGAMHPARQQHELACQGDDL